MGRFRDSIIGVRPRFSRPEASLSRLPFGQSQCEHQVAAAGVLFGQGQIFLRHRVPEVDNRGDEPSSAVGADRLSRHRLLGAVALTPPPRIPPYLLPSVESVAAQATHELSVAVQLREGLGADAGAAMEVVGVLGDQKPERAEPLEFDEGEVRCVGLDSARRDAQPGRRKACVAPRPYPLGAAKVGDARVGTDARSGKGDDVLGPGDPAGDRPMYCWRRCSSVMVHAAWEIVVEDLANQAT